MGLAGSRCVAGIKKPATTKVETGSWLALAAFLKRPQAESNRRGTKITHIGKVVKFRVCRLGLLSGCHEMALSAVMIRYDGADKKQFYHHLTLKRCPRLIRPRLPDGRTRKTVV